MFMRSGGFLGCRVATASRFALAVAPRNDECEALPLCDYGDILDMAALRRRLNHHRFIVGIAIHRAGRGIRV
jgi:hypothetical protein